LIGDWILGWQTPDADVPREKLAKAMPTMVAAALPRPPWCPTPGAKAYNNQPTCYAIGLRC
jgi:hypothetical protein